MVAVPGEESWPGKESFSGYRNGLAFFYRSVYLSRYLPEYFRQSRPGYSVLDTACYKAVSAIFRNF
ncbi:hypothetical protein VEE75_43200 (plasmid) [Escherichia coli]|nr:hypothetical protein VEE75_43200 [Escherichia coli]